jgi:hypothetical protein
MNAYAELVSDLPGLIRLVAGAGATGVFTCRRHDEEARLLFQAGRIVGASSAEQGQIGRALIAAGTIDEALLERALGLQRRKKTHEPLGQILISLGIVEECDVRSVLRKACIGVLRQCIGWEGGTLAFQHGRVFEGNVALGFSVEELLAAAVEPEYTT